MTKRIHPEVKSLRITSEAVQDAADWIAVVSGSPDHPSGDTIVDKLLSGIRDNTKDAVSAFSELLDATDEGNGAAAYAVAWVHRYIGEMELKNAIRYFRRAKRLQYPSAAQDLRDTVHCIMPIEHVEWKLPPGNTNWMLDWFEPGSRGVSRGVVWVPDQEAAEFTQLMCNYARVSKPEYLMRHEYKVTTRLARLLAPRLNHTIMLDKFDYYFTIVHKNRWEFDE